MTPLLSIRFKGTPFNRYLYLWPQRNSKNYSIQKMNNQNKYDQLRRDYPVFTYKGFSKKMHNYGLTVTYQFAVGEQFTFSPKTTFYSKPADYNTINPELLDNILFHAGMVEMISYWKLTCSPTIYVEPFALNKTQCAWWKKLFFLGLGEFFYRNAITPDPDTFITIVAPSPNTTTKKTCGKSNGYLIPVGGGKDSAVTLELLKNKNIMPFIINPRQAQTDTLAAAGLDKKTFFRMERQLDPRLLQLNNEGFLNGHTPFSALLAFYALAAAILSKRHTIVLSNESSANESTVRNSTVNHQYSKSIEFENDFRHYVNTYIADDLRYFSFLRPLTELQISALFSQMKAYHRGFRSCNAGSKTNSWCGKCPKCLFTFILLSVFLPSREVEKIFGANLFHDPQMIPVAEELIGLWPAKPFECVGTTHEVQTALAVIISRYNEHTLPPVLAAISESIPANLALDRLNTLSTPPEKHFLNEDELKILTHHLHELH